MQFELARSVLSVSAPTVQTQHYKSRLAPRFGFRWIQIDDDAGALALEFGPRGVFMLAVKKAHPTDPTTSYWLNEQGQMLGRIQVGLA